MKTKRGFALMLVFVLIGAFVTGPNTVLKGRVVAQKISQSGGITDRIPAGPPVKVNLPNGGYKEVYKNKSGQTFQEDEYNGLGVKVREKHIVALYPNGKEAEVGIVSYGAAGVVKTEDFEYDKDGKIASTTTYKDYDQNGQAQTKVRIESDGDTYNYDWNPKTKVFDDADKRPKRESVGPVEQPELPKHEVFPPKDQPATPKTSTPSTQPEAKPSPNPKSSSPPNRNTVTGAIDPCLVGTWRSESVRLLDAPENGGDGIALTIKADGMVIINYSEMSPIKGFAGESNTWSGSATFHITTDKGRAILKSVEKSEITHTYTDPNGVSRTNDASRGAPHAALGVDPLDKTYQCERDTLTYKHVPETLTFKRQENPSN
jgi:hypothetical protein